jgi:hypothetical protein
VLLKLPVNKKYPVVTEKVAPVFEEADTPPPVLWIIPEPIFKLPADHCSVNTLRVKPFNTNVPSVRRVAPTVEVTLVSKVTLNPVSGCTLILCPIVHEHLKVAFTPPVIIRPRVPSTKLVMVLLVSSKLPKHCIAPVPEKLKVSPPVRLFVKFANCTVPVTVIAIAPAPDALSKITLSTDVGTLAPPPPPVEADQFVVEVVFHVPEPPTQYLSAIVRTQSF